MLDFLMPKRRYRIRYSTGARGKIRWHAYDEWDGHLLDGPVSGFRSKHEASIHAASIFHGRWNYVGEFVKPEPEPIRCHTPERKPPAMRPIELTLPWLPAPKTVDAITLWPLILWRPGYRTNPGLRAHEVYHWKQAKRWGVLPWYLAYVILRVVYWTGGRGHPMERRAYEIQDEINAAAKGATND